MKCFHCESSSPLCMCTDHIYCRIRDCIEIIRHKRAFFRVRASSTLLRREISYGRAWLHDLDKLWMILVIGDRRATRIHRRRRGHHLFRTRVECLEGICDWECARLTKPDKPLTAYETWVKYYHHLPLEHLLSELGWIPA